VQKTTSPKNGLWTIDEIRKTDDEIKGNLGRFYDRDAERRIQKASTLEWKIRQRAAFLARCHEMSVKRVLEVGSGVGHDSLIFKQQGFCAFPFDLSSQMVTYCHEMGLPVCQMDSYHLGYGDKTFDAVWSLNALLHVPKRSIDHVWEEIGRVMRPGAIFFMGVYGGQESEGIYDQDWDEPKRFFSFFTDEDLESRILKHYRILSFENEITGHQTLHFQGLTLQQI
jgi:SAM-dependent methyltransferase